MVVVSQISQYQSGSHALRLVWFLGSSWLAGWQSGVFDSKCNRIFGVFSDFFPFLPLQKAGREEAKRGRADD